MAGILSQIKRALSSRAALPPGTDPAIATGDVCVVVDNEVRVVPQTGASDGDVLTLDSGATEGVSWQAGSGGGGGGPSPATTVVSETSFAQASAVGVSALYARGDHTHGTPTMDAGLLSLAAGDTAADTLGYVTSVNTWGYTAFTSFARSLVDDANAAAARTTLGITLPIPIAEGGTGQTTQTAGFDALSPTTTKGDLIVDDGTNAVRLAVGANGRVPVADSTASTGIAWGLVTTLLFDHLVDDRFGTGEGGSGALVGNTTLSVSANYDDLDLAGFTLTTASHGVACKTRLRDTVGTGIIRCNGSDAVGANRGNAASVGPWGTNAQGGNGAVGAANGGAANSTATSWAAHYAGTHTGGIGGISGAGQTAGAVGTSVAPIHEKGWGRPEMFASGVMLSAHGTPATALNGGSGGSGGGAAAASTSGAGGAGGCVLAVHAKEVDCPAGTELQAKGGNGSAATGANAGGGGGGEGGMVLLVTAKLTSSPTLTAAGGIGGGKVGTGVAGANGNPGRTETRQTLV